MLDPIVDAQRAGLVRLAGGVEAAQLGRGGATLLLLPRRRFLLHAAGCAGARAQEGNASATL